MSMTSSSASSADLETLIGFCAAHPVPNTDAARFLGRLNSGPLAIIDWRELGIVAVLLDAVKGVAGTIPLEVAGLMGGSMTASLAEQLLIEVGKRAASLGGSGTELALTPIWQPHRGIAERLGYQRSYVDYDMICTNSDWGPDEVIPDGWRWENAVPNRIEEYTRVLYSGFSGTLGAFVPSPEEIRRYLALPHIGARVLIDERGEAVALLRYTPRDSYINAVTRCSSRRGRGMGRLVMDEARRRLVTEMQPARSMTLTVVDTNTAAIELYRRCNFEIEKKVTVLMRRC